MYELYTRDLFHNVWTTKSVVVCFMFHRHLLHCIQCYIVPDMLFVWYGNIFHSDWIYLFYNLLAMLNGDLQCADGSIGV